MLPLVTIEGRVVADPELRFASTGMAIAKMRLVSSSRKKNESGEWEDDKTLWINATCFNKLAENVAESIVKGDLVTVVGRLLTEEWTTEGGEKRSATVINADSVAASLQFRTVPAGAGRVERAIDRSQQAVETPPQDDEPPF